MPDSAQIKPGLFSRLSPVQAALEDPLKLINLESACLSKDQCKLIDAYQSVLPLKPFNVFYSEALRHYEQLYRSRIEIHLTARDRGVGPKELIGGGVVLLDAFIDQLEKLVNKLNPQYNQVLESIKTQVARSAREHYHHALVQPARAASAA